MYSNLLLVLRVDILTKRREKAGDICRATRATEPLLSSKISLIGQRIEIEEGCSLLRDTAQHPIIQSTFHHISILRITLQLQHAVAPKDKSNGCTRLGIGSIIWEVIVRGKTLDRKSTRLNSSH